MAHSPVPGLLAVLTLLVVASCDDQTTQGPRYSASDLIDGWPIAVADRVGIVRSAELFAPDDITGDPGISKELEQGRSVVHVLPDPAIPTEFDYDVIVMYRTGPFCGIAPDVTVDGSSGAITIDIALRRGDDCDALEFDEGLGLTLHSGALPSVVANVHR